MSGLVRWAGFGLFLVCVVGVWGQTETIVTVADEISAPSSVVDNGMLWGITVNLDKFNSSTLVVTAVGPDLEQPTNLATYVYRVNSQGQAFQSFSLSGYGNCADVSNNVIYTSSTDGSVMVIELNSSGNWEATQEVIFFTPDELDDLDNFGRVCAAGPDAALFTFFDVSDSGGPAPAFDTFDMYVVQNGGSYECLGGQGSCTKNTLASGLDTFQYFQFDQNGDLGLLSVASMDIEFGTPIFDVSAGTISFDPVGVPRDADPLPQAMALDSGALVFNYGYLPAISDPNDVRGRPADPRTSFLQLNVGSFGELLGFVTGPTGFQRERQVTVNKFENNDPTDITEVFSLVDGSAEGTLINIAVQDTTLSSGEVFALSNFTFDSTASGTTVVKVWALPLGASPTPAPSSTPTSAPTSAPTTTPTSAPTSSPTTTPTSTPTTTPTSAPTTTPTSAPTTTPTSAPTSTPTPTGTQSPSMSVSPTATMSESATPSPSPDASATPTETATSTESSSETATPSATPTATPTPTPTPTPAPICFSVHSSTMQWTPSGLKSVTLGDLRPGDLVQAFDADGRLALTEVVLVQHHDCWDTTQLLRIAYRTMAGEEKSLHVSENHYLVKGLQPRVYQLARDFMVGDELFVAGVEGHNVAKIISKTVVEEPVRNVLTTSDMIVVDGVLASSYTNVLGISPMLQALLTLPLKALHALGLGKLAQNLDAFANRLVLRS